LQSKANNNKMLLRRASSRTLPRRVVSNTVRKGTGGGADHQKPAGSPKAWAVRQGTAGCAESDLWYLDSAATAHMTSCKDLFTSIKQAGDTVTVADGRQLACQGIGTIQVQFEGEDVQISNVLYVPGLQGNLLSVGQLTERGIECQFNQYRAELRRDGVVQAVARRSGRSYVLESTQVLGNHRALAVTSNSYELWHRGWATQARRRSDSSRKPRTAYRQRLSQDSQRSAIYVRSTRVYGILVRL